MSKKLAKSDNETKLQRAVRVWLNNQGQSYESGWMGAYKDLEYGGCQSGMVGSLIYYHDTVRFYKRYQREIDALLRDTLQSTGGDIAGLFGDKWDSDDPLGREYMNQNLLAWFGFEETARNIAESNGYEG